MGNARSVERVNANSAEIGKVVWVLNSAKIIPSLFCFTCFVFDCFSPVFVDNSYEVWNGLLGLKRDVLFHILAVERWKNIELKENDQHIRAVFLFFYHYFFFLLLTQVIGIDQECCAWKDHWYFIKCIGMRDDINLNNSSSFVLSFPVSCSLGDCEGAVCAAGATGFDCIILIDILFFFFFFEFFPASPVRASIVYPTADDRYEGDVRGGVPHGQGVCVFANEVRYEGDWVRGKRTGRGVATKTNGYKCASVCVCVFARV
jgi:hypothetical protein